jgi:hypothetical protein
MGKKKIIRKIKLVIWAVIFTWIVGSIIITALVPIPRHFFSFRIRYIDHIWDDEPWWLASWNRPLTPYEARYLIHYSGNREYADAFFYHLLRHADEPVVRREIEKAALSSDTRQEFVADFALFRLRDNPEERLARVLEIVTTGGLDPDKVGYLLDWTTIPEDDEEVRDVVRTARDNISDSCSLVSMYLDPEQDAEYLPIILSSLENSVFPLEFFVRIIILFRGNPEVDEIFAEQEAARIEEEERTGLRIAEPPGSSFYSRFDSTRYDAIVKENLFWFSISYVLIGVWILAYIFYLRWRFRQIDSMDSADRKILEG